MQKIYTILLPFFLASSTAAFASNKIDSIGVENNNGKKVIIYKVEAKETYYSISKKYNVNYKDVMEFNDNLFLQIGVTLKVPTMISFSGATLGNATKNDTDLIVYTIKAKDNLNMLAEKYGTTINELKRINNLSSINLQIGQTLQIPNSGTIVEETISKPVAIYTPPVKSQPIVNENITEHTVKAKENLNLIAKMYETTVENIKSLNGLTSNNLQIGQVLKVSSLKETGNVEPAKEEVKTAITKKIEIAVEKPLVEKPIKNQDQASSDGSLVHIVTANETIYSIANKYKTTTFQIKTANNLTSNELKIGQKLQIKNLAPVGVNAAQQNNDDDSIENIVTPNLKGAPSKYGISQIEEKGVAIWIEDQDLDPAKMLILHRTAPVGTVIKITNPMTSRSTFGKVVGKFTENETTKDVIIVMTKAVADAIGALDKRFACTLSYGAIDNE